jgi:hypothetical protein
MQLTLSDYYGIFRDSVRHYPVQDYNCLQPQAFRVLQHSGGADVGMDNLGAVYSDRQTPFFYSRKWERSNYDPNSIGFDWPIVTAFATQTRAENAVPFSGKHSEIITLELAVMDVWRQDCNDATDYCGHRSVNQIYIDCKTILDTVLSYVGGVILTTTSADPTERLYYAPFLDAAINAGTITSYNSDPNRFVHTQIANLNRGIFYNYVEMPASRIYGMRTQIQVKANNCEVVEFTAPENYGVVGHESGCVNC